MSDRQETYIYESPDGGHTVYRRPFGGPVSQRELHSMSKESQIRYQDLQDQKLWGEIRRMAKRDPALQDILDQAIVYYHLKSQP